MAPSAAAVDPQVGIRLLEPADKAALEAGGNAAIQVTGGGEILLDSSSAQAAVASGNATVSAQEIAARGTVSQGHGAFQGLIDHSAASSPDPLASVPEPGVPVTVRSTQTLHVATSTTLQPGLYVGGIDISGKASVSLAAGIYYLQGGGFTVSGQASVTGANVLLFNANTCYGKNPPPIPPTNLRVQ